LAGYHLLSMQTQTLGHYLLPNLRSIRWDIYPWDLVPFLRLFLNPGLVDVDIDFPRDGLHIYRPATISLIPTRGLTHLRLVSMKDDDESSMDTLHNLLDEASETLRSVCLDGQQSMVVIEKLLQLPNLRCLDVRLPGTRISPPAVVFPSLEKLVVHHSEDGSWLHILQNIPGLRELVATYSGSSPAYLQTLGSSLGTDMGQTLTSLKCSSGKEAPLTESGLRPFLSFGRLTTLELATPCIGQRCGTQLNDSIISELAMALPGITSLTLGGIPCRTSTSDVTVTGLVALSTNCVDLDFLQLHFNAKDIASRGTRANAQTHRFTCKLRTLSVGSQPLPSNPDDVLLVTFAILHIFPHVKAISYTGGNWYRVRRGVQLFRDAPRIIPLPTTN